jgi:hypothetical protein
VRLPRKRELRRGWVGPVCLAAHQQPPVGDVVVLDAPTHRAELFVPLTVRHVTVVAVIAIDQWTRLAW